MNGPQAHCSAAAVRCWAPEQPRSLSLRKETLATRISLRGPYALVSQWLGVQIK